VHVKGKLPLEEGECTIERQSKNTSKKFDTANQSVREAYRRSKKKRAEKEEWDKYGHLPRLSTIEKSISDAKIWKTLPLITDFCMDDGGYTSRSRNFDNVPEIQSLEEAMCKGFVVIKSENR
jgi:hypothetical protein